MHFKKRFKGTGQWLLDDPRFTNWRDGTQSSLLWCHGARKLYTYMVVYLDVRLILTYLIW